MAKVKKNVFQEFMQEDFVPEGEQYVVKYLSGKGNNLHEVEDIKGSRYLVSMPKKFRQTVWLKKNDCLVVDPIVEGKKVLGEIICVIPVKNVVNIIQTGEWCPKIEDLPIDKDSVIKFFTSHLEIREDDSNEFVPTDSEEELTDEDEDTEDSGEEQEEDGGDENTTHNQNGR